MTHASHLAKASAKLSTGQEGIVTLIKNDELDYLVLNWTPKDDPESEEDYIIMSETSLKNIDGQLTLTDESDSVVFECVLQNEEVEKWASALRQALSAEFPSQAMVDDEGDDEDEERKRQIMRDALTQFARTHAQQQQQQQQPAPIERSLNSFVKAEAIGTLLQDENILAKLAEHVPKAALGNRTLVETLTKIWRSTEFRNAGDELTRALYTPDYTAIFKLFNLSPPPAETHFKDPVMSLLTSLQKLSE